MLDTLIVDMAQLSEINKKELKITRSVPSPETFGTVSFEELLSASMKRVNSLQQESNVMVNRLATGDVDDISEVVLASSRAEIALRLFMELRNKFVDAYQQLSRMSA